MTDLLLAATQQSDSSLPAAAVVAACALVFTVASFWWLNARQRVLKTWEPHSFAAVVTPQLARLRFPFVFYNTGVGTQGIEVRNHATTLYNSIYRADDQALVNAHVWGVNAYRAPVWHLRRNGEGGMFEIYADSFDAVWATAKPVREK